MQNYEVLGKKLVGILDHVKEMDSEDEAVREFLEKYKSYIEQIIKAIRQKTIYPSEGATLGLIRGISDYDELCNDEALWEMVADADKYYSEACVTIEMED